MIQYIYMFQFNQDDSQIIDGIVGAYVYVQNTIQDDKKKIYVFEANKDVDLKMMIQDMMSETLSNIQAYVSYPILFEDMTTHMTTMQTLISHITLQGKALITDHDIVEGYHHHIKPLLRSFIFKKYAHESYMLDTIKTYLDHNQNMSQASKELFIHRNTLMMRLDKFHEVTGFDVKKFYDAYLIYGLLR